MKETYKSSSYQTLIKQLPTCEIVSFGENGNLFKISIDSRPI